MTLRIGVGGLLRGILVGVLAVMASAAGLFNGFERTGLSLLFRVRGPEPPRSPIVIVSIDEDSFDELNLAWPWPRAVHAEFLDRIRQAAPIAVGFDVVFAEPSTRGDTDDRALAEAIGRSGNVVLAAAVTEIHEAGYSKTDLNPPLSMYRQRAAGFGYANFEPDDDAVIRRVEVNRRLGGREWPSLSLKLYELAVQRGVSAAPLSSKRFLINYRGGPKSFPIVPYYRVLNGEVPAEIFADAIVLVGATTPLMHDVFPTPTATHGDMSGVEIQATVLDLMLSGIPIAESSPWVPALILAGAGLVGVGITRTWRPIPALGGVIAVSAVCAIAAYALFTRVRVWVPVSAVPIVLLSGYGATVVESYLREQREKRRLSRFFSPAVLTEIVRHRHDAALTSTRRLITVLFSDLRGFTALSEQLPPEQVVEILTDYLTELTDVVFQYGGTVDKYVGDCIMALYNVPLEQQDHAGQAVRTALEFQRRTRALSAKWEARLGVQLKNGVGISTGEAVVGTMGSRQRLEYTAIGDTVNLAARLESVTKDVKNAIVISEATHQAVQGRFRTQDLGMVSVKGKEQAVRIFAVLEGADG